MFSLYDVVFAKSKEYQPWPAYITKIEGNKFHVVFFGFNQSCICRDKDLLNFNQYQKNILPTKRISNSLQKALDEAKQFAQQTDEEFVYDPSKENKLSKEDVSLNELSELISQLRFEKEKMQQALKLAEEESEEMCVKYQEEIAFLKDRIHSLKEEIKSKDKAALRLNLELENFKENVKVRKLDREICSNAGTLKKSQSTQTSSSQHQNSYDLEIPVINNTNTKLINSLNFYRYTALLLEKQMESLQEKYKKVKADLAAALSHSQECEEQIAMVKNELKALDRNQTKPEGEINSEAAKISNEFNLPKECFKLQPRNSHPPAISTSNRLESVADTHTENSLTIILEAESQIHSSKASMENPNTCETRTKVVVLSDSHDKELFHHMSKLFDDCNVFIYSQPGAELKEIFQSARSLVADLSKEDFIVLLGAIDDLGSCNPEESTIVQGIKEFFSLKLNTNLLILDVPLRSVSTDLNDNVFFENITVKRIREQEGVLKAEHIPVNDLLIKSEYTYHGLIQNTCGKHSDENLPADNIINVNGPECAKTSSVRPRGGESKEQKEKCKTVAWPSQAGNPDFKLISDTAQSLLRPSPLQHPLENTVNSTNLNLSMEQFRPLSVKEITKYFEKMTTPVPAKRDSLTTGRLQNGITRNTQPATTHPLDNAPDKDLSLSLESLDLELPTLENYVDAPIDFPSSPKELRQTMEACGIPLPHELDSGATGLSDDEEEDHSIFQAVLSPDCQDVRLKRERPSGLPFKKKVIPLTKEILNGLDDDQISSVMSDDDIDRLLSPAIDSPDELEDSILEQLDNSPSNDVEPIPELTAEEERNESRNWQRCNVAGVERRIDMKVIEPYKCVLSHGGYLNAGSHNAIIVFSACFLPHHGRVDYNYVMDNLFLYVLSTLDQLITEDYVLVYLHGGTAKDCMPTFSWLKRCYQMIDRRLRKNLKRLYLVHPTFWLKTIVTMAKPFISSKFSKKLHFVGSLGELLELVPLEQASIPDRVKKYDKLKQAMVDGN